MRAAIPLLVIILLLSSAAPLVFDIKLGRADPTVVYFRADGSIDPPSAPIQRDGNIYTFTANISDSIVVERDNIVVDGADHAVQGPGSGVGIDLSGRSNVTIENMEIKGFFHGIRLWPAFNNTIYGNSITTNSIGIFLWGSSNNSIAENAITANDDSAISLYALSSHNSIHENSIANNLHGIYLSMSSNNSVYGNNVMANFDGFYLHTDYPGTLDYNNICGNNITSNRRSGMYLDLANHNNIYHNNFVDNMEQVMIYFSSTNIWDNGYPSGGNFWSDYAGVDEKSGLYQNETGSDGIADTPYAIDADNTDNYPLMQPWTTFTPHTIADFNVSFGMNNVRMIYPSDSVPKPLGLAAASVSDWLTSMAISTKLATFVEGLDTNSGFVNQTTGRALGQRGVGIITSGGPFVNPVVKYAESDTTTLADRAPIQFLEGDSIFYFQYWNGTSIAGASLPLSVINHGEDMFVIETYRDVDRRYVLLCYGFGWKGTYAAGKYFDTTIWPNLSSYNVSWVIVKWQDTNGDDFVNNPRDGDTYTTIAQGADTVPRINNSGYT
ncbi:MAG: nitrous oxide reductase family maturation protein NosD [Candidatus Bathyarchaeia archaeon]